jgi:hypothetical protein
MKKISAKSRLGLPTCAVVLLISVCMTALAGPGEAEVRSAAEKVFARLKAGQFEELYNSLPASSRQRVTKERFVSTLQRSQALYKLDRIEIGAVRINGDVAVADTVMYGHIYKPIESDGKIVAQQYMVKENGEWRVATGDRVVIQKFLSQNPEFARKFPVRASKVYIKSGGQWIDVSALGQRRRAG